MGGKFAGNFTPPAPRFTQSIFAYELTFDDSPSLCLCLTQVYYPVFASAWEEMEIRVIGTQYLVHEYLKRVPHIFLDESWVEIMPEKPRDFHGLFQISAR